MSLVTKLDLQVDDAFSEFLHQESSSYDHDEIANFTSTVLGEWSKNKAWLYELMGGKLYIEKTIDIELPQAERSEAFFTKADQLIMENETSPTIRETLRHSIPYRLFDLVHDETASPILDKLELKDINPGRYLAKLGYPQYLVDLYAGIKNATKSQGILRISIHPMDYLTLSVNGNSWRSCYGLGGEYISGIFSYMMDKTTLVTSLHTGNFTPEWGGSWASKKWRSAMYVSPSAKTFIQSRQYPLDQYETAKEVRNFWEKTVSEHLGIENKWTLRTNKHENYGHGGGGYPDVIERSDKTHYQVYHKSLEEPERIYSGHEIPCIHCGDWISSHYQFSCGCNRY